jgi:hypothetical protein
MKHGSAITSLALSYLRGRCLEVAPYFDPFLSREKFDVDYTDYVGTEELRRKGAENVDGSNREIPDIDFVWHPGHHLLDCIPDGKRYDYIFSSHVIEHVPDPIGWLNELLDVMNVGGYAALFIPDRKKNVDFFRSETSFSQLVHWWMERPTRPTAEQILDFCVNSHTSGEEKYLFFGTDGQPRRPIKRFYTDLSAINTAIFSYNEDHYFDVHCTVWNSETCGGIVERLVACGILNVSVEAVKEDSTEFLIVLQKKGDPVRRPPNQKLAVDAAKDQAFRDSVEHQLKVLRHDLKFLIEQVEDFRRSAEQPKKLFRK